MLCQFRTHRSDMHAHDSMECQFHERKPRRITNNWFFCIYHPFSPNVICSHCQSTRCVLPLIFVSHVTVKCERMKRLSSANFSAGNAHAKREKITRKKNKQTNNALLRSNTHTFHALSPRLILSKRTQIFEQIKIKLNRIRCMLTLAPATDSTTTENIAIKHLAWQQRIISVDRIMQFCMLPPPVCAINRNKMEQTNYILIR